jgi:L-alanine-DL-glutamate epimerase-like enolase superfamily enzyme
MRTALGPSVGIMIDCHSFFDVEQSVAVAGRLEPYNLTWYEEPVPPERVDDTVAIHRRIKQPMAAVKCCSGCQVLRRWSAAMPWTRSCRTSSTVVACWR